MSLDPPGEVLLHNVPLDEDHAFASVPANIASKKVQRLKGLQKLYRRHVPNKQKE
jgi:hypothetical protein